MKTIHILILALFTLVNCERNTDQENESDHDFDVFYDKFLSDSSYQINHIQFPLAGRSYASGQQHSDFKWQREDWSIHRSFDPQETGFSSSFSKISDEFIIETILLNTGEYGMERRFSKFGNDGWHLIYFSDLHPIATTG